MVNMERELKWLRANKDGLNLSTIAKYVDINKSCLSLWIADKKNSKGTKIVLPERCFPKLQEWISKHCKY
jgi:hypothetical protein